MNTDTQHEQPPTDERDPMAELAEHRDQLEKLARMDLAISDEAQRAVEALDVWEDQS